MVRLDGKAVSRVRRERLSNQISQHSGLQPLGLVVVLIGEDPASQVYVRNKVRACEKVGISSQVHRLPANVSEMEIYKLIVQLNKCSEICGILVQLPLPKNLNERKVLSWIDPAKDADGLCVENMGLMWAGWPRVIPCTPHGVMKILEHYKKDVAGKNAVVVGRSQIVGQPMAYLLQKANATVTVCHSYTTDLISYTRKADILVVAAGQPRLVGAEHIKEGAVVVDVGIHRQNGGQLCGDVRYEELEGLASAATPVPGGVGPMTITMLLENTYRLALKCGGESFASST